MDLRTTTDNLFILKHGLRSIQVERRPLRHDPSQFIRKVQLTHPGRLEIPMIFVERLAGLVLLALGAFFLVPSLAIMVEGHLNERLPLAGLIVVDMCVIIPFSIGGCLLCWEGIWTLFDLGRFRFDRATGWITFRRRYTVIQQKRFLQDILAVQCLCNGLHGGSEHSEPALTYEVNLVLDDRKHPRLKVLEGYQETTRTIADQLAKFLGVPLIE